MVSRPASTTIGCLTWLLVLAIVGYVASQVGQPYFRYYRYRDAIAQRVRFATLRSDSAIRAEIWTAADSIGLPEQAYHLRFQRDTSMLHVSGSYDDSWSILNHSRNVPFTIDTRVKL